MKTGIIMKLLLISIVCFLVMNKAFSGGVVYFYTNASNCHSCYSFTIDAVKNHSSFFDSLNIDYKIALICKRNRDIEYYRKYHKLNQEVEILNSNTLSEKLREVLKDKKKEHIVYTVDDSVKYQTSNLYELINYLKNE